MDTQLKTNQALHEALKTIIDLPKGITSLTLTMRMGEAPRIVYSAYVYGPDGVPVIEGDKVKQETRTFRLVEVDDIETSALDDSVKRYLSAHQG